MEEIGGGLDKGVGGVHIQNYVLSFEYLDQCFPNTGLINVGDSFQWPTMNKMVKLNHAIFHLKKNVLILGV